MQNADTRPTVSVVIPTYNRAAMVCDCVANVLATGYPNLEVIVVDDCSPDETRQLVAERFGGDARVKYVRNQTNSLSAHSRNHGAAHASGEYLFFLDDDNLLHRDALVEMVATFVRRPQAGFVAPITCNVSADGQKSVWTVGSYFNPWTSKGNDTRPLPRRVEDIPLETDDFPTMYSPNAFMVTREAFDAVGGFDEVMRMQYDESDFGYRVVESGRRAYIAARAITDHVGYLDPGTTPVLRAMGIGRPSRAFAFGRNRVIFARRHFSFFQALSVTFVFAPLSAFYYGLLAIRNGRWDIALAYEAGTLAGLLHLYPWSRLAAKAGSALRVEERNSK